jgi:hypothetical protein
VSSIKSLFIALCVQASDSESALSAEFECRCFKVHGLRFFSSTSSKATNAHHIQVASCIHISERAKV